MIGDQGLLDAAHGHIATDDDASDAMAADNADDVTREANHSTDRREAGERRELKKMSAVMSRERLVYSGLFRC